MKVIDLLCMLSEYQRVVICPNDELEWNADNPYNLDAPKVRELNWLFVETIKNRTVVKLSTDSVEGAEQYNNTVLRICYR